MDEAERLRRELQREVEILERLRTRRLKLAQTRGVPPGWQADWDKANRDLWEQVGVLSTPAEHALAQLRQGDPSPIPWVIAFLEADPWFFRSGYLKGNFLRLFRRYPLDAPKQQRLRSAILNTLDKGGRLEFGEARRLARRLDTPDFRKQVARFLDHPDPGTRERAQLILASCTLNDQPGRDLRSKR